MSTETIIFIGVGIYVSLMLAVGIYAAKKNETAEDFIVAGRGLPMFLCTATIIATWFGGGTMMGTSGAAYDDGFLGVIADPFGSSLCLILIGLFYARFYRRLRLMTFVELVEQRLGITAAGLTTLTHVVSSIGWVGGSLLTFGLVFQSLTGTPILIGVVAGAAIVVFYTMIGGLWAVALTDSLQVTIILLGLIILLIVVLIDVGGWPAIAARIPEDYFKMLPLENTPEKWMNYFRMWFIYGLVDINSQSLLGRAMAAKSERVAVRSFYVAGFGYLAFAMIPVTLGMIASVTMPELDNSERVIPMLALAHLHPVLVAIFVGAILAAIMSTCDSALHAVASLVSRILLPLVHKNPSDALTLRVARWSIPVVAALGIYIALVGQDVYDIMVDSNILSMTSTAVPALMVVWWKKANRIGALTSMAGGFLTWLIARSVAPELPGDLLGMGACLVIMVTVSLATQKIDPPRPARDIDGNIVEFKDRVGLFSLGRK